MEGNLVILVPFSEYLVCCWLLQEYCKIRIEKGVKRVLVDSFFFVGSEWVNWNKDKLEKYICLFPDGCLPRYQQPKVQNMTRSLVPHMLVEGAGYCLLLYFQSG